MIDRSAELTTESWLRILDGAADHGLFTLEFTGGDPFVRDDAVTLMTRASARGITLLVNSDLSVLGQHHLDWLSELPTLHAVQTSLDGATAESCDATRGPGGFRALLRSLQRLAGAGLPVSVGTTVHAGNYTEVRAIARLAAENGATRFYVAPMYAAGRAATLADQVVTPEQWAVAVRDYAAVIEERIIAPTDVGWADLAPTVAAGDTSAVADQVHLTSRGSRSLRVDPRGRGYVTAKLREFHPRFATLGEVTNGALQQVWADSDLLHELRRLPVTNRNFDAVDVRDVPVGAEQALTRPGRRLTVTRI